MRLSAESVLSQLTKGWKSQPRLAWLLSILWLALICWIAFLWNLGNIGLIDETEPLFVEAARQMTVTGDWITPYFNNTPRFDKPPLVYWLMAAGFKLIGVNEWAARLPSALSAIAMVGLGFYTLRRFGFPRPRLESETLAHSSNSDYSVDRENRSNAPTESISPFPASLDKADSLSPSGAEASSRSRWLSAWIGGMIMALTPETMAWARMGVSDMLLSGCIGCGLFSFFLGYAQPERPKVQTAWFAAFYTFLGLAVLAKGPVGVVLPGLTVLAFLLYQGQLKTVLKEMHVVWGSLWFLAIAVPWYILVIQANGQAYIDSFFGYHNFQRFTSVVNGHSAPGYFYFIVVLLGFFPWSIYLPNAMARLRFWRRRRWQQQPRSQQLGLFALTWFVAIFAFFTAATTKLPSYVLPLMPAAAVLVGLFWSDWLTFPQRRRPWGLAVSSVINILMFIGLAVVGLLSPSWMTGDPAMPNIGAAVQDSQIMVWSAIVWISAAIAATVLILRRQMRWMWGVNFIAIIAFIIVSAMPAYFILDQQRQLHLRQISQTILDIQQPNEPIVMVDFKKPSLVFYTQQPVEYIYGPASAGQFARTQLARPEVPSVLIVGRATKMDDTGLPPEQLQMIHTTDPYQLMRVTKPGAAPGESGSASLAPR
jgi:4-amino-4-deoxy-L-arabinose transferase-like glycosyltransferase